MKLKMPSPSSEESDGWTWGDRLTFLLGEYKWHLTILSLAGMGLMYHMHWGIPSWGELPRWFRIAVVAIPVSAGVAYVPASKVVDAFFEYHKMRVNEIDAGRGGEKDPAHSGVSRSWDVPPALWENKEIVEGSPYLNFDGEWNVKRLEWDKPTQTLKVWGPWKGEMTDVQLETWFHALSETQGRQRFWMQAGKALKMRLPSWLRSMEQSITERVTRMTMDMSTDSLEIYQDEVVSRAESMTDSVDVPEGYYNADFADEVEQEVEQNIDEATSGAWSEIEDGESE